MQFEDLDVANIAHRGASGYAPENTMPAFEKSLSMGADGIELDVQLTKDGHVIVLHDGTLDRTTSGRGPVTEHTLAAIQQYDAGYHFVDSEGNHPFRNRGICIPTLESVLQTFPETPIIIELKAESGPGIVEATARIIQQIGAEDRVILGSFETLFLQEIRQLMPSVTTGFGKTEVRFFTLLGLCHLDPFCNPAADVLLVPDRVRGFPLVTRPFMRAARRLGYSVHVWTIEETPRMREMLALGVDGIMTGYPDRLAKLLLSKPG